MVTPGRFELPTRSLGNCCSIHLSYGATLAVTAVLWSARRNQPTCKMHGGAMGGVVEHILSRSSHLGKASGGLHRDFLCLGIQFDDAEIAHLPRAQRLRLGRGVRRASPSRLQQRSERGEIYAS